MNESIIHPEVETDKIGQACEGDHHECVMGIRDAMEVLSGKWKIQIIGALIFGGRQRFMDLLRAVDGIGAKMLSKELQDLEANKLLTRTVFHTKPITVEYEMTAYGQSLKPVFTEIAQWGMRHRRTIMTEE